jgi:hypothetical protein
MTFPAEGVALTSYEKLDDAIPLTVFLSALKSDGTMFQLQRRSVTKAFAISLLTGE